MEKQLYTAALIGTGRIGFSLGFDKKREQPASHTMALLANKRIRIIAGADTNQENLTRWKSFVKGAKTFDTSEELYNYYTEQNTPDIIVVAVNEDSHFEECIKAIKAHPKLIILEKPVALNSEEAT